MTVEIKTFISSQLILLLSLVVLIISSLMIVESGDLGVAGLGLAVYFPYILLTTITNAGILLGLKRINGKSKMYHYLIPPFGFLLLFILFKGEMMIRFWGIRGQELFWILFVWLSSNLGGYRLNLKRLKTNDTN